MTNKNGPVAAGLMRVVKGFPEVMRRIGISQLDSTSHLQRLLGRYLRCLH